MRTMKKLLAENTLPSALVHPRTPIKLSNTNGNCDGGDGECTSTSAITGTDQVERTFGEMFPVEMKVGKCSKDCCKAEATDSVGDNSMTIREICFTTDSGGVTTIRSMEISEG